MQALSKQPSVPQNSLKNLSKPFIQKNLSKYNSQKIIINNSKDNYSIYSMSEESDREISPRRKESHIESVISEAFPRINIKDHHEMHNTIWHVTYNEEANKLYAIPQDLHSKVFLSPSNFIFAILGVGLIESLFILDSSPYLPNVKNFFSETLPSTISNTGTLLVTIIAFPFVAATTIFAIKYFLCTNTSQSAPTTTLGQYFRSNDFQKGVILFLCFKIPNIAAAIEKDCGTNNIDTINITNWSFCWSKLYSQNYQQNE